MIQHYAEVAVIFKLVFYATDPSKVLSKITQRKRYIYLVSTIFGIIIAAALVIGALNPLRWQTLSYIIETSMEIVFSMIFVTAVLQIRSFIARMKSVGIYPQESLVMAQVVTEVIGSVARVVVTVTTTILSTQDPTEG